MQAIQLWFLVSVAILSIAGMQWWAMHTWHSKKLSAMRARHASELRSAAATVQYTRQQADKLRHDLDSALQATKHPPVQVTTKPAVAAPSRARLNRRVENRPIVARQHLDNGFAPTLPSQQFAPSTTFGLLQSSTGA